MRPQTDMTPQKQIEFDSLPLSDPIFDPLFNTPAEYSETSSTEDPPGGSMQDPRRTP